MSLDSVHAVIVAVEDHGLGPSWELNGPCKDAVAMAAWLTGVGVPGENIRMLASPLQKNCAELASRVSDLGLVHPVAPATEAEVARLLRSTLPDELGPPANDNGLLLIYWTGHGVFDSKQHPPQRNVFCSDLTRKAAPALPLEDTVRWLRTQLRHMRLALVIDACALHAEVMKIRDVLLPIRLPAGQLSGTERPFLGIYSCSEGQVSRNVGQGLFTRELLAELASFKAGSGEDFDRLEGVIRATRERVAEATKGKQVVSEAFFSGWSGKAEDPLKQPRAGDRAEELDPTTALLCDRVEQWGSFKVLAHSQVERVSNRSVITVTYGGLDQEPDAFHWKIVHRIRQECGDFGRCSMVSDVLKLDLGLCRSMRPEWLHAAFRREMLGKLLLANAGEDPKEQLKAISKAINDQEGVFVFAVHVPARLVDEDKSIFLELRGFWKSLPTIKGRSLAVLAIFVSHEQDTRPAWLRWLGRNHNATARQRIKAAGNFIVEPELASIGRKDLYAWRWDMSQANPRWRQLTESELDRVCLPDEQKPMGKAIEALQEVLESRIKAAANSRGGD